MKSILSIMSMKSSINKNSLFFIYGGLDRSSRLFDLNEEVQLSRKFRYRDIFKKDIIIITERPWTPLLNILVKLSSSIKVIRFVDGLVSIENSMKKENNLGGGLYFSCREHLLVLYQPKATLPNNVFLSREYNPNDWKVRRERIDLRKNKKYRQIGLILGNDFIFDRSKNEVFDFLTRLHAISKSQGLKFFCVTNGSKKHNTEIQGLGVSTITLRKLSIFKGETLLVGGKSTLSFELLEAGWSLSLASFFFSDIPGGAGKMFETPEIPFDLLTAEVDKQQITLDKLESCLATPSAVLANISITEVLQIRKIIGEIYGVLKV